MLQLMERLAKRSRTDSCMPYDTSTEKIVRRLQEHEQRTIPVIKRYEQQHGVKTIDGTGNFDQVFEACATEIQSLFQVGNLK